MDRAYLVTGTGTGAGKTYVTSCLLKRSLEIGYDTAVLKPVETGCRLGPKGYHLPSDGSTYLSLGIGGKGCSLEDICLYTYGEPLSPNIAARMSGHFPDLTRIISTIEDLSREKDLLFVEGAGGLLVEILDGYTFHDLARDAGMGLLLVAPNRLGVLNQVALNMKFIESHGGEMKGIILNDVEEPSGPAQFHNPEEIRRLYGDRFLLHLSHGAPSVTDDIIHQLIA
jgi:dethiobiotin synthetase